MTKIKSHDKKGHITSYGFLCGYVERYPQRVDLNQLSVEMYKEHNTFHVRMNDTRINSSKVQVVWDNFDQTNGGLKAARKRYNELVKRVKKEVNNETCNN